jgi:GAF domain-containing protein
LADDYGAVVSVPDLELESARWPRFAPTAVAAGLASVHAVPMTLHTTPLGVLGLFGAKVGALDADDLALDQSLANVAGVALVSARSAVDGKALNAQLQRALNSRVIIEQAKGFLSSSPIWTWTGRSPSCVGTHAIGTCA